MARLSSNSRRARAWSPRMSATPPSDVCDPADAPGISELPCQVDGLLERPLGIVELPARRETHADLPERSGLHVRIDSPTSNLEGLPGQGEGRVDVPGSNELPCREARARSRPCGRRPSRRCTARLSSSNRRRRLEVALESASEAIMVCAFARVLGEPEPSASSSSRRSRPSCTWLRSCQKRQSAEPILSPTSASPVSTAQVSAARMLSRSASRRSSHSRCCGPSRPGSASSASTR